MALLPYDGISSILAAECAVMGDGRAACKPDEIAPPSWGFTQGQDHGAL
jgi:hypothetical protein